MKHGAGILLIKDGKVLLVRAGNKSKQLNGAISFPGGTIEQGESPETAAKRELTEETGLVAGKLIDFSGNYIEADLQLKLEAAHVTFKVFLINEFSGELKANDETEPFWMDLSEARKIKLLGKNNEILENAIKFLNL